MGDEPGNGYKNRPDLHRIGNQMSAIPQEILSAIGGAAVTALVATIASTIRGIPFKFTFGNPSKNGKTVITVDMLKENCSRRQELLNKTLGEISIEQKEIKKELGDVKEDVAYIKGRIS